MTAIARVEWKIDTTVSKQDSSVQQRESLVGLKGNFGSVTLLEDLKKQNKPQPIQKTQSIIDYLHQLFR